MPYGRPRPGADQARAGRRVPAGRRAPPVPGCARIEGGTMKIWISCDMEGVAGIVDWDQCRPGNEGYALGCELMQDEVNAAIEGAIAAGATEIVVTASHGRMANLAPRKIGGGASSLSGRHKPMYMT